MGSIWNIYIIKISFYFIFKNKLLWFNYNCLQFVPTPSPHPSQTHLPPLLPPFLFILSMCPLQQLLKTFLPTVLSPSPLAIVTLFLISMSLVIFCLLFSFVDYVPVKGDIIWYLSLTTWLIHLAYCSPVPSMLLQRV